MDKCTDLVHQRGQGDGGEALGAAEHRGQGVRRVAGVRDRAPQVHHLSRYLQIIVDIFIDILISATFLSPR